MIAGSPFAGIVGPRMRRRGLALQMLCGGSGPCLGHLTTKTGLMTTVAGMGLSC
jgi:hypothetical protein